MEMYILKRLLGECGTPVCMPATWKMLKKRFFGKVIHCISAKKHILRSMLVGCSRFLLVSFLSSCFLSSRLTFIRNFYFFTITRLGGMVAGRFQDFRVQKMISHYEFVELNPNGFSKEYTHDIALLKLDREAILNA